MVNIPWNTHLAALTLVLAFVMVSWSLSWGVSKVLRKSLDPMRAPALMGSLRIGLVGLSLIGVGVGWLWDIESLLVLSLIFGVEELYETSLVIVLLKSSEKDSVGQAPA